MDELHDLRAAAKILDKCIGCSACLKVCPVDAIQGSPKKQHVVDPGKCISCGMCIRKCKQSAIQLTWFEEFTKHQTLFLHE